MFEMKRLAKIGFLIDM